MEHSVMKDKSESTRIAFRNDAMALLSDYYTIDGKPVLGQSISFLLTEMRYKGWRLTNRWGAFEDDLASVGIKISSYRSARNRRNQPATIAYIGGNDTP